MDGNLRTENRELDKTAVQSGKIPRKVLFLLLLLRPEIIGRARVSTGGDTGVHLGKVTVTIAYREVNEIDDGFKIPTDHRKPSNFGVEWLSFSRFSPSDGSLQIRIIANF
jgi:hypothetical protein